MNKTRWIFSFILIGVIIGIGLTIWPPDRRVSLRAARSVDILEKPYPIGHPYENSKGPNNVIGTLAPGDILEVYDTEYDKDFAVYEVKHNGSTAYIIAGRELTLEKFAPEKQRAK